MASPFRKDKTIGFFGVLILLVCTTALNAQKWQLVWADEFAETDIDRSKWSLDSGPISDNIHYFTDRPENAQVVDGILNIIALEEPYQGYQYTAAHLKTKTLFNWR